MKGNPMHHKLVSAVFAVILTLLFLTAARVPHARAAEDDQRVRVRGTVVSLNAPTLTVKTREGETVDIALAEGWTVSGMARVSVTDIKPGDFVGIASLPRQAGGDGALEVLVFPPAMKGTGEGSREWDLKPNSSMTNGTVAQAVTAADEHTVTVTYHGNEKKIAIPDGTPIVTFAPATPADLKPGAVIFLIGEKSPSGITARRVTVGTNGITPPM
jgi:hypothetical protein